MAQAEIAHDRIERLVGKGQVLDLEDRANAIIPGDRSTPMQAAPRRLAFAATDPGPVAMSSRLDPAPAPAASSRG